MSSEPLTDRLARVRERVRAACVAAGRPTDAVTLLAVSKGFTAPVLAEAAAAGQRDFGENYVQEALAKIDALAALPQSAVAWHFQGPLQSNKTAEVAARFDWVHSIDREKIARRLS